MTPVSIAQLRAGVRGRVIGPDDAGYDEMRIVVSGECDRRPSAIVRPTDADEVALVVRLAAESGTELAVRSGGHSGAGHSTTEGGLVLDLRDTARTSTSSAMRATSGFAPLIRARPGIACSRSSGAMTPTTSSV